MLDTVAGRYRLDKTEIRVVFGALNIIRKAHYWILEDMRIPDEPHPRRQVSVNVIYLSSRVLDKVVGRSRFDEMETRVAFGAPNSQIHTVLFVIYLKIHIDVPHQEGKESVQRSPPSPT